MTHGEYLREIEVAAHEYESKKIEITKRYIDANNPYKIGDTVTDHIGSLIIERIKYCYGYGDKPCAVYYGTEVKKYGTPMKRQSGLGVYQSNLIQK